MHILIYIFKLLVKVGVQCTMVPWPITVVPMCSSLHVMHMYIIYMHSVA